MEGDMLKAPSRLVVYMALLTAVHFVSGCSGGGGGGSHPTTTPTTPVVPPPSGGSTGTSPTNPTTPVATPSAGYSAQAGLSQINVQYGWQYQGKGATVAIVDSQFDVSHPAISGNISTASENVYTGTYQGLAGVAGPLSSEHGTNMASIIGAGTNIAQMQGVAPQATLLLVGTDNAGCGSSGCVWDIWNGINYASQKGAKIINLSVGNVGSTTNLSESDSLAASIRNAYAAGSLLIAASGNESLGSPDNPARYIGGGNVNGTVYGLAVGAVNAANKLMGFSNGAGDVKSFVVAPGVYWAAKPGGGYAEYQGTSGATAFVSGVAALILAQNPQLTNSQLLQIITSTATPLGDAATYGYGLVNASKALAPIGQNYIPAGTVAGQGGGATLANTTIVTSPSVAQALNRALTGVKNQQVMFFDSYNRGYSFHLSQTSIQVAPETRLWSWVQTAVAPTASGSFGNMSFSLVGASPDITRMNWSQSAAFNSAFAEFGGNVGSYQDDTRTRGPDSAQMRFTFADAGLDLALSHATTGTDGDALGLAIGRTNNDLFTSAAWTGNSLSLAGQTGLKGLRWTLGYASAVGGVGSANGAKVGLEYQLNARQRVSLGWSEVLEQGRAFGVGGSGAYTMGGATSGLVNLGYQAMLTGALSLDTGVSMSRSDPTAGVGLLRGDGGVIGMGWHTVATWQSSEVSSWGFGVSQPTRLVSGGLVLDVPVARTDAGTIIRNRQRVSLVPTGQEIDYQATYSARLGGEKTLSLAAMLATDPDHVSGAAPEVSLGLRYSSRY